MGKLLSVYILLSLFSFSVLANQYVDEAPLDPPYPRPVYRLPQGELSPRELMFQRVPVRSDVSALIAKQSPVRSQGSRGTCSIFSATALLESLLIIDGYALPEQIDLSEEWLEYVATRTKGSEGSSSPLNFYSFARWGSPTESAMPYIGETWESAEWGQAKERCGHLQSWELKTCLIGHWDPGFASLPDADLENRAPEFLKARREALELRQSHTRYARDLSYLNIYEVKQLLAQGIPVTLDQDFYYGAWNHRKAVEIGIDRDMMAWDFGQVGFPEIDSIDRDKSPTMPAGHSVVLVGYDDERELTYSVKMKDGTVKSFTRKGVFYFKNSWGLWSFGSRFELDGKKISGYGVMTQDYANQFGTFHRLLL